MYAQWGVFTRRGTLYSRSTVSYHFEFSTTEHITSVYSVELRAYEDPLDFERRVMFLKFDDD